MTGDTRCAAARHHDRLLAESTRAYDKHIITQRSDGRWLLQSLYDDGKPRWDMATEIVSLAGGQLYVGGDIDHVVFAYYSDKRGHEDKVYWMGRCDDITYYVRQKARIGMGRCCQDAVDAYDENVARDEVAEWARDARDECGVRFGDEALSRKLEAIVKDDEDALDELGVYDRPPWEERHELLSYLNEVLGYDYMYERWDVGGVLSARVYYAHAALRRLCDLLDEERAAAVAAQQEGA